MKATLADLAILGGTPAFSDALHVGTPNICKTDALLQRVRTILATRRLTNDGDFCRELESRIATKVGVRHCIAVCNGTLGLEIAIRASDLSGEVIVPSFTFVATAHALQWLGLTPVFCDIDPQTHNLDPHQVELLITPRTTGIIGVHVWGRPCDVAALSAIASRHGLTLLFDAAHAFGSSLAGHMVGSFGRAEVFSFHATKFFNTFEGGAILTNDDHLAHRARLMRNFGFAGYDTVISLGTNAKMSEVSAAMGLTSLESFDDFVEANRRNYRIYERELSGLPGLWLLRYDPHEQSNYQYVILEVEERETGLTRDQFVRVLHSENVLARRYFYPGCHRMEPYSTLYPEASTRLPHTERIAARVLALPTGTFVTESSIREIAQIFKVSVIHGQELTHALRQQA